MPLSVRWHRLEASAWVHRLLMLEVALLGLLTAVACIGGLAVGVPLLWLLPAGLTAVAAWLAHAWGEGRRWSWWALLALSALGAVLGLLELAARPSWWRVAWLLLDLVVLALLAHPDSTARLDPRPRPALEPRWAPAGRRRAHPRHGVGEVVRGGPGDHDRDDDGSIREMRE